MLPTSMFGLWTYLFGVSNLTFDITASLAPKSLRLDYDGNCALFERLQNCAQLSTEKQKDTELLISDIRSNILWDQSFTDDQRMVFTYEKLHGFYVRHPEWLDECTLKADRSSISIQKFVKAGKLFKQMRNMKKVLGGNLPLLVEYLSMLKSEPTLDSTVKEQLHILVDNLKEHFVSEPRVFKRLEFVAQQTVELLNPQKSGSYIKIDLGSWGQFDDLLECYSYYKTHGFHWNDPNTKSAHCAATSKLISLRADNHTILTDAIDAEWKRWRSMPYRVDFRGYLKRIHKIVESQDMTNAQKLVEIARILYSFNSIGKLKDKLMEIEIENWGKMSEFCDCQSVPSNNEV